MSQFPCLCNGPTEEQHEEIQRSLTDMFRRDATPLPIYSGIRPLTYSETDSCPCQQNWWWMTRRLLALIQARNDAIGTDHFTTCSQQVQDHLYIFSGDFLRESQETDS